MKSNCLSHLGVDKNSIIFSIKRNFTLSPKPTLNRLFFSFVLKNQFFIVLSLNIIHEKNIERFYIRVMRKLNKIH
jgi:hypothetical protein